MSCCRSLAGRFVRLNGATVLCLALLAFGASLLGVASSASAARKVRANIPKPSPAKSTAAVSPLVERHLGVSSSANTARKVRTNIRKPSPAKSTAAVSPVVERLVVNPHNFRYVLNNPNLCRCPNGKHPDMFVWIHTAPLHFKQRMLIRETWGNPLNFRDYDLRMAFFVGDPQNDTAQALLSLEAEKYGDIVQEDFVDSYRNLTYKAIMGLKWVHTYCSGARMILKADDDVVADIFRIVRHVRTLRDLAIATEWTILCNCAMNSYVMREGKWAVTTDEYPDNMYPPYCPGMALLMTPDLVYPLYLESLYTRYFWVDDVYFSGILAKQIKVNFHPSSAIISPGWLESDAYLSLESDHVFIQVGDWNHFLVLWNKMAKVHSRTAARNHCARDHRCAWLR